MMPNPDVRGHRFILTVDLAPGPGARSFEDLLAEIARDTAGRLTRMDFGLNDMGHDVVLRRSTIVRFGEVPG